MQEATWLQGRTNMCIFSIGRALLPTQEEKTICTLVERIYLIIVSREGNQARFELFSKIFESFNVVGCIPLQCVYGHAKKGIIYAWIVHRWILNRWIVYRKLAQPKIKILVKPRSRTFQQKSITDRFFNFLSCSYFYICVCVYLFHVYIYVCACVCFFPFFVCACVAVHLCSSLWKDWSFKTFS